MIKAISSSVPGTTLLLQGMLIKKNIYAHTLTSKIYWLAY